MGDLLHTMHSAPALVLSVPGPHAGEDMATILARKLRDIPLAGRTFWFHNTNVACPPYVQQLAIFYLFARSERIP
ncbi:MAG: hypothetical protein RBG13Loki_0854 [Promethearchaeota archaeon CR_4]|nr:MAG: hypothetical protein RBG13Loki_0854 [Candidatus Lokiarchaeota archaeon CR_4]